jgi:hypothetical protein
MQVVEVKNASDKKEFLKVARDLYKDDPCWVAPLDIVVEDTFDPLKNNAFHNGEAIRWILKNDEGNTVGRIAAFINYVRSAANNQPTGGLGYFEVINDRNAAFLLFDTAKKWLSEKGMHAMDGPINFGENDNNWGLLVDGFIQQSFGMPYNMKYYQAFFEDYGFRNYFEQYSYHRIIRDNDNNIVEFPERMTKISEWLLKKPGYAFRHFELKNKEPYINDIVEIYNSTWSVFKEDFTPLEPEFLDDTFQKMKAFIDEDLIWFAYHFDKPVAFFILYPDLNQILKHLNGSLSLLNKLRFVYLKNTHAMSRMRAVAGGVHPSHQNSGIESAIFLELYKVFKRKKWYRELELSWVGDFNPKMIAIYEALGASRAKVHVTYRYMINKDIAFRRYREEMDERLHNPDKRNS